MGNCTVPECPGDNSGRTKLCAFHYQRKRQGKSLDAPRQIRGDNVTRFWSKVDKNGPVPACRPDLGPCWMWTDGCDECGYGIFTIRISGKRRKTRAHRWLLGHLRGRPLLDKPVGVEEGCHHCDNPPCVNPAHLFVGSRSDNMRDMQAKGREVKARGAEAGNAKLTEAQVLAIRGAYGTGTISQYELAAQYAVDRTTIGLIVNRKNWKHVA